MDDILDDASREIRRLEHVIRTLKDCLIAAGLSTSTVAEITTEAYNYKV